MNSDFITALKQIEKEREIPLDVICTAIEDALTSAYKNNNSKKGATNNQDVAVVINRVTGAIDVKARKKVVDRVENSMLEISLPDALKINKKAVVGEEINVIVTPSDFGRIAAQTAKQVIVQRIREAERDKIFDEFVKRENTIVTCTAQRHEHDQKIYADLGKLEGVLAPEEQVENEHFKYGDRFKALILRAEKTQKGPQIILSRASSQFVAKLFEYEVPEIKSGLIVVKGVVREPGNRSKIAVESKDPKIDPVGACVGPKGSRVQAIVEELKNEKIDIIAWSSNPEVFIANSLNPSRVLKVILDPYNESAIVIVPDQQLSLAIGKEGQNVRLAVRLTNWKIDILSESQYMAKKEEIDAKAFEFAKSKVLNEIEASEQFESDKDKTTGESEEIVVDNNDKDGE